jgi:hypothetical protein
MTDELRDELRTAAGTGGGSRPDVADLWRTGQRRRTGRRLMGAAAVVASLAVGAVIVATVAHDDTETVRAGSVPTTCRPRSGPASEGLFTPSGEAVATSKQAPRTPAAMVHGGGSEHLGKPVVVARVKVLSTRKRPSLYENLGSVNRSAPDEVRSRVEVTDPVFGADVGDRFTISDAGTAAQLDELKAARYFVQERITELQVDVNQASVPLAELDQRIADTDPNDPAYAELVGRREELRTSTDARFRTLRNQLNDYQQRLQVLQLSERLSASYPTGTSCHRFEAGDDLVVALVRSPGKNRPYELTGPSSFFLVDGDGFSEELDAARRSVDGWGDSPLLELARRSTPDEFLDDLRRAKDD